MDIDPPPRGPDDPSDQQLERLGLPTHHVHFSTDQQQQEEEEEREEILRPDDLSIVTYQPRPTSSAVAGHKAAEAFYDYPQDDPNAYQV